MNLMLVGFSTLTAESNLNVFCSGAAAGGDSRIVFPADAAERSECHEQFPNFGK